MVCSVAAYEEGPGFDSQPGDVLRSFVVFLYPAEKCCISIIDIFVTFTSYPFHFVQSLYSVLFI